MLRSLISAVALVALACSTPALGQEPSATPRVPKDRSCLNDCRSGFRTCAEAVRNEFRLCRADCDALLTEARTACADPASEACASARAAAAECLQPCGDAARTAVGECRTAVVECGEQCPEREPLVDKDRACLQGCRAELTSCRDAANLAARACSAACGDETAAATRACLRAPRSEACRTAREALGDCLLPCRDDLASATRTCVAGAEACVESCPTAATE